MRTGIWICTMMNLCACSGVNNPILDGSVVDVAPIDSRRAPSDGGVRNDGYEEDGGVDSGVDSGADSNIQDGGFFDDVLDMQEPEPEPPPRGALPAEWIPCPVGSVRPESFGALANDEGSDSHAIAAAIEAAASDMSAVCFSAGVYEITESITMMSGISFIGAGTVLHASDPSFQIVGTAIRNLRFVNLTLDGLTFSLGGSTVSRNATDFFFDRLTMRNSGVGTNQLLVTRTQDVHVTRSVFVREAFSVGRGIVFWKNADALVEECSFDGYYMTAININGSAELVDGELAPGQRSVRHVVRNVAISRTPGDYDEDHGIYAVGFDDLVIEDVEIGGWSATAYGGALKIRNGDHARIRRCSFRNSGVLLYTYEANHPHHLRDVRLEDINVTVDDPLLFGRPRYPALSYWRNFARDGDSEDIEVHRFHALDAEFGFSPPISAGGIRIYDSCALGFDGPPEVRLVTPLEPCGGGS